MKILLASRWLVMLLMLVPKPGKAQQYKVNDDCAFPITKRNFNIVNDDQPVSDADLDLTPTSGAARTTPDLYPWQPHLIELAESQRAYDDGRLTDAAASLETLLAEKPVNPNVLYHYARALYRDPAARSRSYPVYLRLISLLDKYGRENANTVAIYTPFAEAYHKLATLQMDNAQWALAAYNLSRALFAIKVVPSLKVLGAYEEALQYQTECFSHLGNAIICRYFGQRTLKYFPQNQYVRPYLAKLPSVGRSAPKRRL